MATIILGDIIDVIKESVNPKTCGFDKFVGLEHYDAGEPMITRYGSPENLDTNVKHFCKGDILVARRNVYLKRAGYVDFEGVTSGDSIVLRVKDKSYLRILPFILNTEDFWDYAEQNSDGTMSKRLSPDDLMDYEFEEPENKEELAEKLWAAYRVKESYRKLLAATDDMVKAKFVEMFGDLQINDKNWPLLKLDEVAEVKIGPFGSLLHSCDYISNGHSLVNPSHIINSEIVPDPNLSVTEQKFKELLSYRLQINDIVMGRRGEMGRCALVKDDGYLCGTGSLFIRATGILHPYFLQFLLSSPTYKSLLEKESVGTTMMNLNVTIVSRLPIPLLPHDLQSKYMHIISQAEATKASLRQSIESIDRVIKSLINQ